MFKKAFRTAAVMLALVAASASSLAATVTINWTDSGWYDNTGFHDSGNKNYISGPGSLDRHNYFVFNLSSVASLNILSATLRLTNPIQNTTTSGVYTLHNVATSIASLSATNSGATGLAIHNDLGTGTAYGSINVDGSFNGGIANIALNAAALADLNAATGLFALGGEFTGPGFVFGFTNSANDIRQLVLETGAAVPEPGTLALLGLAFAGLGMSRRKAKQA